MTATSEKKANRSEALLRRALLVLLESKDLDAIAVSELCRQAGVSRGTFYLHYRNVSDVYAQLLEELAGELCPLLSSRLSSPQITDNDEGGEEGLLCYCRGKTPFCALARQEGGFESLMREDRFIGDLIDHAGVPLEGDLEARLMECGYDWQQARIIRMFQLAGCYIVATRSHVSDDDWPRIRVLLDRFVSGGIKALTEP